MARIRSIKPEFWSSEQVMTCSRDARLLFIGLWNFCDDAGRCPCSPKTIKAQVLPGDDDLSSETVQRLIDELSSNGLVSIYEAEGRTFLQVTGWSHQKIDRPKPSKYPAPIDDQSTIDRRSIAPDLILSEGIKDRRGAGDARAPSSMVLPEGWRPALQAIDQVKAFGLTESDIEETLRRFGPHYRARGETRADWNEQFLAWCADEAKKRDRRPPVPAVDPVSIDPQFAPIYAELVKLVGSDVSSSWFSTATVKSLRDDQIVITAPSKFIASYWESNLRAQLKAAAETAYPAVKSLSVVVIPAKVRKSA